MADEAAFMTGNRPKDAWIWVAVAAITLASLACAQSGIEQARAYATPVIKFLSASQLADSGATTSAHHAVLPQQAGAATLALELLPVLFVGLIVPLSFPARSALCIGHVLPEPDLSNLFERPPPVPFE
jgi:hypothetical protein